MSGNYQVILTGFESLSQASRFLDWFEHTGEQDWGIEEFTGIHVQVDVAQGKTEHAYGVEYRVKIFHPGSGEEDYVEEDDTGGCDYEDDNEQSWDWQMHP